MILHNKSTKQQEQEGTGPIVHKDGKQSPSHVAVYIKDPAVNVWPGAPVQDNPAMHLKLLTWSGITQGVFECQVWTVSFNHTH